MMLFMIGPTNDVEYGKCRHLRFSCLPRQFNITSASGSFSGLRHTKRGRYVEIHAESGETKHGTVRIRCSSGESVLVRSW
jgi:hypothetical protein